MMQAFAASAATALATAQDVAAEGLRRSIAATEQERTHWARELHDETLQSLAMTRLTLASALREPDQQNLAEPIASAIAQIDGSIANLRNLIADLRPAALDALGAGAAIETLVAHLGSRTNIEIELAPIDLAYERGIEPEPARSRDRGDPVPDHAGGSEQRPQALECHDGHGVGRRGGWHDHPDDPR